MQRGEETSRRGLPPGAVQLGPATTPRLEADLALHHEALPTAAHSTAVATQAARAVLPLRLGQLQLVEDELDEHAVVLGAPLLAIYLTLQLGAWRLVRRRIAASA